MYCCCSSVLAPPPSYEVLWSKYLSLLLGSTVQAQTVVLAVFMGGLALGNHIFGKRSDLLTQPLGTYGFLEILIALYGFFFVGIYALGDTLYIWLGTPIFEYPALLFGLKLLLSALLLLGPTILMGGTLPLLAAWIQRQPWLEAGSRIGLFYAVNSLGAVLGAGLAGLWMVPKFGLGASLQITAFVNAVIGALAIYLSRQHQLTAPGTALPEPEARKVRVGWAAVLVAITGGVSMGLEVLAARSLALIVGSSLQAFALVLMAFILGIGLGSVVIASARFVKGRENLVLYFLLIAAGTIVAAYVVFIEQWVIFYSHLRVGLAPNASGYLLNQIIIALLALAFLGLPAMFLGAVVPLTIRLLAEEPSFMGQKVGRLLTWNTLGAVAGVLATGFIFMPLLGLRASFALLSIGLLVLAALIAFQRGHRIPLATSGAVALLLLAGILLTGESWRALISSGVFRSRTEPVTRERLAKLRNTEILYYKDAPDATVAVERQRSGDQTQIALRINGKTDATSVGDLCTQYLVAHLPMIMRPGSKDVFVLGFGSGITAGALLGHPSVERIVIAENCQPVLEAARHFEPFNRGIHKHPKALIRTEDARAVLKLSPQLYDVIISEPSNPWVAGIGSVFTREYYELAATRLKKGGIMTQWFHIYEMHDDIVFLVLRTFAAVFPHVEFWDAQNGDIVMLGSMEPWDSSPEVYSRAFTSPQVAADLRQVGLTSGVSLSARQIASQRTAFAIPGDGLIQTDEYPILEYAAPRAFFYGQNAKELFQFDERTLQSPLVPAKTAALRQMPDAELLEVFTQYSTSNPGLREYLLARTRNATPPSSDLSVAFRPLSSYPDPQPAGSDSAPLEVDYQKMEAAFLKQPGQWPFFAGELEKVFAQALASEPPPYLADFAELALRYAIGKGDYYRAVRFLQIGLALDPASAQFQFLQRILDRVPPPEIQPLVPQPAK